VLDEQGKRSSARKHERQVDQVEDHDPNEQSSRTAEDLPAENAEHQLDEEIEQRISLKIQAESRAPRYREKCDVRLVLNDVEYDVRQNTQRDGGANLGATHGLPHAPCEGGEQSPGAHRVRVGKEIEMDGIGCDARVLDAKVGEYDPEQLDELNRNEKRPEPDAWISLFQNKRC
jgi:hypothetical protein